MPAGNIVTGILGVTQAFDNILVNATAVVYSPKYKIETNQVCGLWFKSTSVAGTPNLLIQIQQSWDTTDGNFVIPEGCPDIITILADENPHVYIVTPYPMSYLRLMVTGNATNPADSLITGWLFLQ